MKISNLSIAFLLGLATPAPSQSGAEEEQPDAKTLTIEIPAPDGRPTPDKVLDWLSTTPGYGPPGTQGTGGATPWGTAGSEWSKEEEYYGQILASKSGLRNAIKKRDELQVKLSEAKAHLKKSEDSGDLKPGDSAYKSLADKVDDLNQQLLLNENQVTKLRATYSLARMELHAWSGVPEIWKTVPKQDPAYVMGSILSLSRDVEQLKSSQREDKAQIEKLTQAVSSLVDFLQEERKKKDSGGDESE